MINKNTQLIVSILIVALTLLPIQNSFDCNSAFSHIHNDVVDGIITITGWSNCVVTGTINSVQTKLWANGNSCPLKATIPNTFFVRYDKTCKQILTLSTEPLEPFCLPTPTPTPTPSPTPTITPTPSPIPTPTPCLFGRLPNGKCVKKKQKP